jgi:hypothetical protein
MTVTSDARVHRHTCAWLPMYAANFGLVLMYNVNLLSLFVKLTIASMEHRLERLCPEYRRFDMVIGIVIACYEMTRLTATTLLIFHFIALLK